MYKRQREAYNQRRRYLMYAFQQMGLPCFEPVSYTHLDVYQRQLYNMQIITLGRQLCRAQKPKCEECFLTEVCPWYEKKKKAEGKKP